MADPGNLVRNLYNIRATLIKAETDAELSVSMPILINEQPKLIWDDDHARTQTDFLNSIDPEYFRYLARVHGPQVEGDDSLNAAAVLRTTYSHALESLFAFIGAALQAPYGPAGWLLAYRIIDLQALIRRVSGEQPFHNMLDLQAFGWDEVANVLLPPPFGNKHLSELRAASARLWKRLAQDMVDDVFVDEYNSLKHGLRARPSNWRLAIGVEDESGAPPSAEQMHVLQSHPFGSSFLRAVPLKKHQMTFEEQRVNWTPAVLAARIPLIADSIQNVLTFLKWYNGAPPEKLSVRLITESAAMDALAPLDTAAHSRFTRNARLSPEMVPVAKREEILEDYLHAERVSRASEETN